jgi:hypothetical protein
MAASKKVKAIVTGKIAKDGEKLPLGSQIDIELDGGKIPDSLIGKVKLVESDKK